MRPLHSHPVQLPADNPTPCFVSLTSTSPFPRSHRCSRPKAMVSGALELHRFGTGRDSRVITALTLLKSHLFKCGHTPPLRPSFLPCLPPSCLSHRSLAAAVATTRYQGHVSAALVLGGVDFKGPHLFTVRPSPSLLRSPLTPVCSVPPSPSS